jgi:Zn-dependent metalloprotease
LTSRPGSKRATSIRFSHLIGGLVLILFSIWAFTATPSGAQNPSDSEIDKPKPASLTPGTPATSYPTITSLQTWLQRTKGIAPGQTSSLESSARLHEEGETVKRQFGEPVPVQTSTSSSKEAGEEDITIRRSESGAPRLIRGDIAPETEIPNSRSQRPSRPSDPSELRRPKGSQKSMNSGLEALSSISETLRLRRPADELQPIDAWTDAEKTTHVRYQQVYKGVPVWGRELVMHADEYGQAYAITSSHVPTPKLSTTAPSISERRAQTAAEEYLNRQGVSVATASRKSRRLPPGLAERHPTSSQRLVIYASDLGASRLAYEIRTVTGFFRSHVTLVDATTRSILTSFAEQCTLHDPATTSRTSSENNKLKSFSRTTGIGGSHRHAHPPSLTSPLGLTSIPGLTSIAGSFVDATGTDLTGSTQSFRAYQGSDGIYRLISDLDNFDDAASTLPPEGVDPRGGAVTLSLGGQDYAPESSMSYVTSTNGSVWNDPAAVSAHDNAEVTYTYFETTHGRASIDNDDGTFYSLVHVTRNGQLMENAFWTNGVMAYGDGGSNLGPLAEALDIAAHEMTHGVISNSANLKYQFESGALNESFADVFGVMVDRDDFLVGEDITLNETALRDVSDPSNPNVISQQPDTYGDYRDLPIDQDDGGVHVNSGIPNRAAYLVIQSIGRAKAEQIYYRALTTYLNPTSDFLAAREALVQSANDLYGAGEVDAVAQAFDAVGITPSSGSPEDPSANDVPPIVSGTPAIGFVSPDGTVNTYNPSTGGMTTYQNATAYQSGGTFSKLSAPTDGTTLWFVDSNGYLSYIDLATGDVFNYPDLYIQQPGDLRSAAISPDGSAVALVSDYAQDDQLYIWAGGDSLGVVPIQPPTTAEGIDTETVTLLDVVSWSPNTETPALVVDAFNETGSGSTSLTFWDIHEVDFASEAITPLFGTQPGDISLGNPTYTNTDPDVKAFNVVDTATGVYETVLFNEAEGQVANLGISDYSYDGEPIEDAQRPTFAPDDSLLAFTTPSNRALLFFDPNNGSLSATEFSSAAYNPHWFRQGGERLPVELAQFDARLDGSTAELTWTTASETNNAGFHVQHRRPGTSQWRDAHFIEGQGTTEETTTYQYAVEGLRTGVHRFRLRQVDTDGTETLSETVTARVRPNDPVQIAVRSSPSAAPGATISLRSSGNLRVMLYDILGRTTSVLYDGHRQAGNPVNITLDGQDLPSGTYFLRARTGQKVATKRIVVVR